MNAPNQNHVYGDNICNDCHSVRYIYGDVNYDGVVDARDIVNLKRRVINQSDAYNSDFDLNNDGVIDSSDIAALRNHLFNTF